MKQNLIDLVWTRAGRRCEYCRLPDGLYDTPFSVDHIIALKHGGTSTAENLALACMHCNLHKGPNIAGIDSQTGAIVALFHPRTQNWSEHFVWRGPMIVGLTTIGRATVATLALNAPEYVAARAAIMNEGLWTDPG